MKLILYNSPESEEDRNGLKPSERIRIPCKKAVRLEIAQSVRIPPYGFSESNPGIPAHTGEHALDHFVGYRMREQNQEVRIADSLPALPRPGGGHSPQLVSFC